MIFSSDKIFLGDLPPGRKASFAIFLSGSGTNAEILLADEQIRAVAEPVVLVTDAPEKSLAKEIAERYDLPLAALSIRGFYAEHGLKTISLATEEGRQVRELWTDTMRSMLQEYPIDFAVLAGFESLTNLTNDYPCINVHPGDLTVTDSNGERVYIGLHSKPVEAALLAGETTLRSSVIIAMPFTDADKDMDNGVILGISHKVPIGDIGHSLEELRNIKNNRTGKKPAGGWQDDLEKTAHELQDKLKKAGDHFILPLVVRDFAKRCFAFHDNKLYYRAESNDEFSEATSLEYDNSGKRRCRASFIKNASNLLKKYCKISLFAIFGLLLATIGMTFWYLPGYWNSNIQTQVIEPNNKVFRIKNVSPGKFRKLKLNDIELGKKNHVFLQAPTGNIELDTSNAGSLKEPVIKRIELQRAKMKFDHNKLTFNDLTIKEIIKSLKDLPRNKNQQIIPLVISGLLQSQTGEALADLTIEITPAKQDSVLLCTAHCTKVNSDEQTGSWNAEIDLNSGHMTVAAEKDINEHIFAYLLKTAGTHKAAVDLLKSAAISGQCNFQYDSVNDRISELFFKGTVKTDQINWYKTSVKLSQKFTLSLQQSARQLKYQIETLSLQLPDKVTLQDVVLTQKPFGSRLNFSASCDLRQTAVDYLCRLFGHPSIRTNSTRDKISGSWNMRTGTWKIAGKTNVYYYQKNVKLNKKNQPYLELIPQEIDFAASGKGSSGTISKLHLDFINLEYQDKLWSCRAAHGFVDITANFGKDLAINPDTINFVFKKLDLSAGKLQARYPYIAGQMNLRQQNRDLELKIAANGPQGYLKTASGSSNYGRWSCSADLKSKGEPGIWNVSRFMFEVPELTFSTGKQDLQFRSLLIRGSGTLDQCDLTDFRIAIKADNISSADGKLQKPHVDIDFNSNRKASDRYRVGFSCQQGSLTKSLFGVREFRNCKLKYNSPGLDLKSLPSEMQLQVSYLDFQYRELLFNVTGCSCQLEQINGDTWKSQIGFSGLELSTRKADFGSGNFGKGSLALQTKFSPQYTVEQLVIKGSAEQPVWFRKNMNITGKKLDFDLQSIMSKNFALKGDMRLTQADYISDQLAISSPIMHCSFEAADMFNIAGMLNITDGSLNLTKYDLELRNASLNLPWLVTESPAQAPRSGKISARKLFYKQQDEGSFSGSMTHRLLLPTVLRKAPEHTLEVNGTLLAEKFDRAPVQINLLWHLPPENQSFSCKLAMPEAQLVQMWDLKRYLPLPVRAVAKKGIYSFNILFNRQANTPDVLNGNFTLLNSELQLDSLHLQDATANWLVAWKNDKPVSAPQDVFIGTIRWKDHLLKNNDLKLSLSENSQLLITSWNAQLLDGKLKLAEPLNAVIPPHKYGTVPLKFDLSGITAERLFQKIKLDFIKSKMKLSGSLNTYLDTTNNKLYIDQAVLSARTPQGELLQITPADRDAIKVKDQHYRDFALAVLSNMLSNRAVFKFALKPGDVDLKITVDGPPARPVPFVYQGSEHGSPFRPAEPGEAGFANELELNVNLKMHPEDPGL